MLLPHHLLQRHLHITKSAEHRIIFLDAAPGSSSSNEQAPVSDEETIKQIQDIANPKEGTNFNAEEAMQQIQKIMKSQEMTPPDTQNPKDILEDLGRPGFFTRQGINTHDGAKQMIEAGLWGTQGILRPLWGTVRWSRDNLASALSGAVTIGNTGWEWAKFAWQEAKALTWGTLARTSSEINNRVKQFFSWKDDVSLSNAWWKKPWHLIQAGLSPVAGIYHHTREHIFDLLPRGTDEKIVQRHTPINVAKRTYHTLKGNEKFGIAGIAHRTGELINQTFWKGPVLTQGGEILKGLDQILIATRKAIGTASGLIQGIPFQVGPAEKDPLAWRKRKPPESNVVQFPPRFSFENAQVA